MSHIVEITTEVRDATAVQAACRRLGLNLPVQGITRLFSGQVTGLAVELPGWKYPVVCETASGQLRYDNYGGRWGEQKQLDRFLQSYAIDKAKLEARKNGHSVREQELVDGSVRLTINVGGATRTEGGNR